MNRRSFTAISATIASAAATEATTPMPTTSAPEFHLDYAPGRKVTYHGEDMDKAIKSETPSLPLGEWVQAEAVVKDGTIQHWINGKMIMEYSNPRFDDGTPMIGGHISLQAESHPCQFRNIEIKILD